MNPPLLNSVSNDGDSGQSGDGPALKSPVSGTAAANEPASVWRSVIIRVVLGGLALLGLAGVGAASMLAGLDGARANPPSPSATSHQQPATSNQQPPNGAPATSNPASPVPSAAQDTCTAGRTPDGKVILNLATIADLRTLPNIGQKRAQAILTLREKLKKFHRVQELRRVKGIGAKTLQKLSPKILIDPPAGLCTGTTEANAKKT
jgi:competence protein ComEA